MTERFFIDNRRKLAARLEEGSAAVLFAGKAPLKRGDEYYPFSPDRNFYYVTGVERENCVFLMAKVAGGLQETLFIPRDNGILAKWVGANMTVEEAEEISGMTDIRPIDAFTDDFAQMVFRNNIAKIYLDLEHREWDDVLTPALRFAKELREKYPERKLIAIDSLCASLGEGLLLYLAAKKQQSGASMDEVADYVRETIPHLCHWFTVNDLMFLKRGGRVDAATALVGTVLQIKPVMHTDDAGTLKNVTKARGRKAALKALAQKLADTAINPAEQTVFICHGDCYDDAKFVADYIRERSKVQDVIINYVGPVIGSHTGPGVVSVFFLGTER